MRLEPGEVPADLLERVTRDLKSNEEATEAKFAISSRRRIERKRQSCR